MLMSSLELQHRIARIVGQPITHVRAVDRGYTAALRLRITLADGTSMFVKAATTDQTAAWLRAEHHIYQTLSGAFLADYLGWDDDAMQPILVLEDLSDAMWPPPWTAERIQSVIDTLGHIAATSVTGLPRLEDEADLVSGWHVVAQRPDAFLALGLATEQWLHAALPTLLQTDARAALHGQALVHADVRSDNLCFINERTIFVDWNLARIGNPLFDLASWLPSLAVEGGPAPATMFPNAGELAAVISGYFASKAGLPPPPSAPRVRQLQLAQLKVALPWAIHTLGLPALDG